MNDSPLKVVTLNCQSITRKKAILDNLIQEYTPIGTESWLNPTISSTEIFSSNFAVFRQDRIDGFLACCKSYNWENLPLATSDNNLEAVACKLQLKNNLLIIIALYRPPNNNFTYLPTY